MTEPNDPNDPAEYTIIGLSGYAGTGKDTVRALLEELGYNGMAFAEPIRGMLRELLSSNGIDDFYMDQREHKEAVIPALGVSYRHMAQTLGTEWGRGLSADFWTRLAGAYMADIARDGGSHFVISDVRFASEAAWVRARGGQIWRVERPGVAPVRAHASEAEIYHFVPDVVIQNTGSIDDLRAVVADAVRGVV